MKYNAFRQLPTLRPSILEVQQGWLGTSAAEWLSPRALELTYTSWDLGDLATARVVPGLDPHVDETATEFEYARPKNPIQWVRTAEPFIALDIETTLTDQSLCLAQVGTARTNYLIDPFTVGDLAPLAAVVQSDKVEKVIHNAQFEKTVLGKLGIGIESIYDTLTVSRRKYGPLAAGHSLLAVVRRELALVIDKRCQMSDWEGRPLSTRQKRYAALDVEVLVALEAVFHDKAQRG